MFCISKREKARSKPPMYTRYKLYVLNPVLPLIRDDNRLLWKALFLGLRISLSSGISKLITRMIDTLAAIIQISRRGYTVALKAASCTNGGRTLDDFSLQHSYFPVVDK